MADSLTDADREIKNWKELADLNWELMKAHLKSTEELFQITRDKFAKALEVKEEWDGEL